MYVYVLLHDFLNVHSFFELYLLICYIKNSKLFYFSSIKNKTNQLLCQKQLKLVLATNHQLIFYKVSRVLEPEI